MGEIAQIEPSYDDLAFEPEMTWDEFVEKAKELGYECPDGVHITSHKKNIEFCLVDGKISHILKVSTRVGCDEHIWQYYFPVLSRNRTPTQMYQIMKALED